MSRKLYTEKALERVRAAIDSSVDADGARALLIAAGVRASESNLTALGFEKPQPKPTPKPKAYKPKAARKTTASE
jgi:hypothetical protein